MTLERLNIEDFAKFYEAAHGYKPFAWQERLAAQVCRGKWPDYLKLPTSSGKTAAIDVAVFALAYQAHVANSPDGVMTAAHRIFFVVDRRIIVNEAYRQTQATAKLLWDAVAAEKPDADSILWRVGTWLRKLANSKTAPPLDCFELRGGIYRDDAWVRSPLQPTVLTSTVDQVGSRMLFRGYGVSDRNLPIHAALTTCDSLIILDEAHCSKPFSQTVEAVARYRGERWADEPVSTPFSLVQMTATPPADLGGKSLFTLSDHDYEVNELLEKRHACTKPITLDHDPSAKGKSLPSKLAKKLVQHAHALAEGGCEKVAVVVNRVAIAREVFKLLEAKHGTNTSLMIGRMRPIDREELTKRLQKTFGSGTEESFDTPQFVVATQCLEVGADLDFDGLVSQCASLDALRQRFGRLNRLGAAPHSRGVIVAAEGDIQPEDKLNEDKPLDPVYGNTLARTWHWLDAVADVNREVDFGIKPFGELLAAQSIDLSPLAAPSSDAPVLMPAHVDMLCQTSPRPTPEPDVAMYLHGPGPRLAEVRVCWRADLRVDAAENRTRYWTDAVEACPPTSAECLSVPISLVKKWLCGETMVDTTSDVLGELDEAETPSTGKANSQGRCCLVWKGKPRQSSRGRSNGSVASSFLVSERNTRDLAPNDTLVIPAEFGGWDLFGHLPGAPSEPAPEAWRRENDESRENETREGNDLARIDIADQAFSQSRARTVLRVHPNLLVQDSAKPLFDLLVARIATSDADLRVSSVIEELVELVDLDELIAGDDTDGPEGASQDSRLRRLIDLKGTLSRYPDGIIWITPLHPDRATGMPSLPLATFGDEEDSLSETGRLALPQHLADVFAEATRLTDAISLPELLCNTVTNAAKFHDIGKADPRFQAMLLGKPVSVAHMQRTIWAKSDKLSGNTASELPTGFRHEMLTVDLLHKFDDEGGLDRELLAHVVASHHGYARPLAPVSVDESLPGFNLDTIGIDAVSHEERAKWTPSYQLDSGIAERFWTLNRRFGWWGLAHLESLLRLADWAASAHPNNRDAPELSFTPFARSGPSSTTSDFNEVVLTGIDGSRPLGFLAALGVFHTLGNAPDGAAFRFAWRCQQGAWRPVVSVAGDGSFDQLALVESLLQRLACETEQHPSLSLAELLAGVETADERRGCYQRIAEAAAMQDRGDADWMSCNGSDAATREAISQLQTSRRDYP